MAARTTITDRVFASLRESILTGELAAGSLHSIYRLADALEVSRTPVRDAVLRLADAGLVTIERNRGVRVRGVGAADVRAVFELRLLLEVPAAWHAAARRDAELVAGLDEEVGRMRAAAHAEDAAAFELADRALHTRLAGPLGNARLPEEVSRLRESIQSRGASTLHRSRGMAEVLEEHLPIVEAVRAGDPAGAAARMHEHLVHTATLLMRQVGEAEEQPPPGWAERLLPWPGGPASSSMLPSHHVTEEPS